MFKLPGFLAELAVIATIVFLFSTSSSCVLGVASRDRAREAETKANLHTIQIALERYAIDHSGAYPNYIMGGDMRGWDPKHGCRAITEAAEDKRPPEDPLIKYAYMNSYPTNPFVDSASEKADLIAQTGSGGTEGYGDVRFGFDGSIMGNCLDDPRWLFDENGNPTNLQYTMLPDQTMGIGVIRPGKPNSFYCMGGLPSGKAWWPGQFYYRSGGDFFLEDLIHVSGAGYKRIWGWPYMRVNKYILGAYGSLFTEGMDVIRLTTKDGLTAAEQPGAEMGYIDGQYYQDSEDPSSARSHPDFKIQVLYSNPEVHGGGEGGLMPQFPYYTSDTNAFMFGAPDGFRDGIILVLTSGANAAPVEY